jgi:hypothetical protein
VVVVTATALHVKAKLREYEEAGPTRRPLDAKGAGSLERAGQEINRTNIFGCALSCSIG